MSLSRVGVILERGGGYRIVVERLLNFACHIGDGEKLILLPKIKVQEPVSISQIAALQPQIDQAIRRHHARI